MVAKIVVVKGCSRRVRCTSLGATVTMVPTAFSLAYRLATVLSIANFNMHCGMDGWGRRFDYLAAIAALDADIVVLEETWTDEVDGADGQAERAARHLGYQVVAHTIGEGRRIRPQRDADHRWIAQPSMRDRNRALFIDGVRPVNRGVRSLTRWQEAEPGSMGIAVLVRPELPIEASRVLDLRRLKADRMRRAAHLRRRRPHVAPPPGLAAPLRRTTEAAAHRRPARRRAGRGHELVGPPGPVVHARLAALRDRPELAFLAPTQPDRPH